MSGTEVAIIGAGMAGLTAAQKLLSGGARVTIMDKAQPGGRASSVVKDGFHINQGPHALYRGGSAYRILGEFNIRPAGARPQPKQTLVLKDNIAYELPAGVGSIVSSQLLSITDKIEWVSFFNNLANLADSEALKAAESITISDWLAQNVKSENIRTLIKSMVRLGTYANCPERISAWSAIRQLHSGTSSGVEYSDNGWQSMVDSLDQLIAPKAERIYGATVSAIKTGGGKVEIVVNGEIRIFDNVILALPPLQVEKLLGKSFGLAELEPVHAACLDVCLNKLSKPDNIFAIGYEEPLYYSVHSATAKLAPEPAQALIHLAVYLKPGEVGNHGHEERLLQLLEQLQPGFEKELVYKRFLPNMVASYGTADASRNACNGLMGPELPDTPGVYVCGDWVGKGELLLDAAMASAESAALAVLAKSQMMNGRERMASC